MEKSYLERFILFFLAGIMVSLTTFPECFGNKGNPTMHWGSFVNVR
jgi:hypothetical protein